MARGRGAVHEFTVVAAVGDAASAEALERPFSEGGEGGGTPITAADDDSREFTGLANYNLARVPAFHPKGERGELNLSFACVRASPRRR